MADFDDLDDDDLFGRVTIEARRDFQQHMARVIECTIGVGVRGEPGCTLCTIRGDDGACPTHVGKAAAAAVMQSWTDPVPKPHRRWRRRRA